MPTQEYLNSWYQKTRNFSRQGFWPCVVACLSLIVIVLTKWHFQLQNPYFIERYTTLFRVPLFSGFLTIGSFMLSFKAFTILRLHDDVYKSPDYMERWLKKAEEFHLDPKTYLDPLARLTDTFFLAILFSLATAFLQLTIGLIPRVWAVCLCSWFALFSGLLVVRSLYVLRLNLVEWQKLLSTKYATQLNDELKARKLRRDIEDAEILAAHATPSVDENPESLGL